jgi:hypothetical protein
VLEDGLPPAAAQNLEKILGDGTFLKQSVMLAFDEEDLDYSQVADSGIWISRVLSQHHFDLYRCGINLRNGRHFDLLLVIGEAFADAQVRDTLYWLMALSEHPSRAPVLPRFGACRPDLGALSVAYISDLRRRLIRQPCAPAPHLEELYELQASLGDLADREVFSRMVFPRAPRAAAGGPGDRRKRTQAGDRAFRDRGPAGHALRGARSGLSRRNRAPLQAPARIELPEEDLGAGAASRRDR